MTTANDLALRESDFSPFEWPTTSSEGGHDAVSQCTDEPIVHRVYEVGSDGPAILLMHELPGMTPECIRLAQRLARNGFKVYLPLLLGQPGRRAMIRNTLRTLCIARELRALDAGSDAPLTQWLRALGRKVYEMHSGRCKAGIGVIGMCFTGGFVLSLVADPHVLAGVAAQPAYPFLDRSWQRWVQAARSRHAEPSANRYSRVLGLRFAGDRVSPPCRFDDMRSVLGEGRFCSMTLPSGTAWIKGSAHSVLTEEYRDWPGHPTHDALECVLDFMRIELQTCGA